MTVYAVVVDGLEAMNRATNLFNEHDEAEDYEIENWLNVFAQMPIWDGNTGEAQKPVVIAAQNAVANLGTPAYLDDMRALNKGLVGLQDYLNTHWRQFISDPVRLELFKLWS